MVGIAADRHYARALSVSLLRSDYKEQHMTSSLLKPSHRSALATIVALAGVLTIGSPQRAAAQEYRDQPSVRTLEGSWWVQVTALADCTSRTPLLSFPALLTFADGGTMTGTTANPGFAVGQRTPDHGVWYRARARHTFKASSVALVLFTTAPNFPLTPGFQAGSQRLDQTITVTDSDHFTSDAVTRFFDASGHAYREGCATAVGQRFE
jgi:hypothetical protein